MRFLYAQKIPMHAYVFALGRQRPNNRQAGRQTLLTYIHLDYKQTKHTFIQTYTHTGRQTGRHTLK